MKKIFVRGLFTLAPLVITIALIVWLFNLIDKVFANIIIDILGPRAYFPGLGFIIALILVFVVGLIMSTWLAQKGYEFFEKILNKMPLIKTLYQSIVDMTVFFRREKSGENKCVVIIKYGETKMLGFICREEFKDLPSGIGQEGDVAVYIPLSFQIGGLTVMVPRSFIEVIDMSFEDGLRFAATAAMPGANNHPVTEKLKQKDEEKK